MQKKSFRTKKPTSPSYPRLREVDHTIMSRWGLATLGGLLLGGAACTPAHADQPPPGEPPAPRVEKKPDGKATQLPDAGAAVESVGVRTLGRTSPPRIEESKGKTDKGDKKSNTKADKTDNKKANTKDPKTGKKEQAGAAGTANTTSNADAPIKPDKPRMMGKMRMPRPEELAPEDKQKAPEK